MKQSLCVLEPIILFITRHCIAFKMFWFIFVAAYAIIHNSSPFIYTHRCSSIPHTNPDIPPTTKCQVSLYDYRGSVLNKSVLGHFMILSRELDSLDYVGVFLIDHSSLISILYFPSGSTNAQALPVSLCLAPAAGIMDDSMWKLNMTLCVYVSISFR